MSGLLCSRIIIALRPQSPFKPHFAIDNPFCQLNRLPLDRPAAPVRHEWRFHRRLVDRPSVVYMYRSTVERTTSSNHELRVKGVLARKGENLFEPTLVACSSTANDEHSGMHSHPWSTRRISFHVRLRFPPYITPHGSPPLYQRNPAR